MERKVRKCCDTCEFNTGYVCAGYGKRTDNGDYTYGMLVEKAEDMFPNGCGDWELAFRVYQNM